MSKIEKRTNFDDYLFRAHAISKLLVGAHTGLTDNQKKEYETLWPRSQGEGKPLTERQTIRLGELVEKKTAKPSLSQTTISYLQEIFNEEFHGRRNEYGNKYTEKGLIVEGKSLTLYSDFLKKHRGLTYPLLKNKERFSNDRVTGEPDFVKEFVGDIKSSWDLNTFPQFDMELNNEANKWQMKAYLWLTGKTVGRIIYCLVDTPEHLILDAKFRKAREIGVMDLPLEIEEEIERNMVFSDLSIEERVREFEVEVTEVDIALIKQQVELSRKYLNQMVEDYEKTQNTILKVA